MAVEGIKLGSGVQTSVFGNAARGVIIRRVIISAGGVGVGAGFLDRRYGAMNGRTRGVGRAAGWPGLDQNGRVYRFDCGSVA